MSYKPTVLGVPLNAESLEKYLFQELLRIADNLQLVEESIGDVTPGIRLPETTAEPASPVDRQLVFADGTSWDPGSGRGFYWYNAGVWEALNGGGDGTWG